MKKITASLFALATVLAVSSAAHADVTPGWYAGAGLGANMPTDPTMHLASGKQEGKTTNYGMSQFASVGYAWTSGLRLEGEFYHNQNDLKSIAGVGGYGHIANNILFANAFYDFKTSAKISPYIGVGLGVDYANVKQYGTTTAGFLNDHDFVGAYQGIAGVSAQLNHNWALTADYRYVSTYDPKGKSTVGGEGRTENASHNLMLGLRYSFGQEPAAPAVVETPVRTPMAPVVAPRAPAKPVVAPVAQNFTVFFDFNRSTLTPEAKRIIAAAAQEYSRGGFAKISVTGHTDTVGTATYNQKLSERRARAVEEELTRLGVDAAHIKAAGVGKDSLLIPTADGVREAQNRRAEIVLSK